MTNSERIEIKIFLEEIFYFSTPPFQLWENRNSNTKKFKLKALYKKQA